MEVSINHSESSLPLPLISRAYLVEISGQVIVRVCQPRIVFQPLGLILLVVSLVLFPVRQIVVRSDAVHVLVLGHQVGEKPGLNLLAMQSAREGQILGVGCRHGGRHDGRFG